MRETASSRLRVSVKLTFLATALSGVIQAATMVLLARLLGPVDYGFYIVCLSINALSVSFFISALERAMVIEPDETALTGRAVPLFLFLCAVGCVAIAICGAIRGLTGWQVDLRVLAIMLGAQALAGLASVPRAILRRRLTFGRIVGGELCGQLLGSFALAAVLASAGWGAFALAFGFATAQLVAAGWVLTTASSGLLRPRIGDLGSLLRTMWGVVKVAALEAVNGQITPVAVTSVLGVVALGLFNRVYNLVTLPVQLLVSSVNRVMISGLVAVADDAERRRAAMRTLMRVVSTIITPLALGVAGAGHTFVAVVLGDKWMAAVPIIPLLSIAVVGNMMGTVLGQLVEAVQRFNDKVRVQALSTLGLVTSLLIGGAWGLVGVASGAAAGALLFFVLYLRLTCTIIAVPFGTLLRWLLPSWVAGAASFAAARGVEMLLAGSAGLYAMLAAQIAACGAAAGIAMMLLDPALLIDLSRMLLPAPAHRLIVRFVG